jgi:hypothetical protein
MSAIPRVEAPRANDDREPATTDLAAIEREWPLTAAELDLVDAEVTALCAGERLPELDRRRLHRAEHRVLVARRVLTTGPVGSATTRAMTGPDLGDAA